MFFIYRKRQTTKKGKSENDSPTSNGPRAQGVGAENLQGHGLAGHGTLPLAASQPRNHRTSSNTQTYDRSHVTGASSSTASSHGIRPNPPPSPSYTMRTEHTVNRHFNPDHLPNVQAGPRQIHGHYRSTHSVAPSSRRTHHSSHHNPWPQDLGSHQRGHHGHRIRKNDPPPTPASTDYNEDLIARLESLNLEIFYGSVVSFRSCDQENNVACLIVANIAKHHVPTVYLNRIVAYYEHTMEGFGPSLF